MNKITKAHLALVLTNLIYGANYIIAKEVTPKYILPFGMIVIRATLAFTIYSIFHHLFVKEKIQKKDIVRLIICGFLGAALNQLLFFKGLTLTTPINASVIMTTNPILVLIAASIILKEKITINKIVGITLGAVGAILLIGLSNDLNIGINTSMGDLLIFLNSMSYGFYLVLIKPLMNKYNPLTVIKWVFCFGCFFSIPVGYNDLMLVEWRSIPGDIWAAIFYIIIATTCIAYLCNMYALKTLNPSIVSTYIYLQPIFAGFIALCFNKDELTFLKIICAFMIFMGVYFVSKKDKLKDKKDTPVFQI